MAYIVLARKWRPMTFEKVIGQEHVTRTLINALKNQRIAHAYIFAGPRGVGKTTTARLLAKAVNCEKQPTLNPCNSCSTCQNITKGNSLDVIEIDGASNRGIDEIRNLRENIKFAPASARHKIYIIDEVHMLTKEAFNALLKTLEEPPRHAIFIFATTEIHKVPPTILSRCQRYDFKRIPVGQIQQQLSDILVDEKIEVDPDALLLISRKADGSMRDAESILDQLISFSDGKLSAQQVRESLGIIEQEIFFEFNKIIQEKNNQKILSFANKIVNSGHDLIDFLQGLQEHLRNMLLIRTLQNPGLLDVSEETKKMYQDEAKSFEENDLIHYIQIITDSFPEIKYSTFPQLSLEMLLLKIAHKPASINIEEVLALIHNLKKNPKISRISHDIRTADLNRKKSVESIKVIKNSKNMDLTSESSLIESSDFKKEEEISNLDQKLFQLIKSSEKSESVEAETIKSEPIKISLESFKGIWPQLITRVTSEKVALGSFLQESVPYEVQGENIILAYNNGAIFHKEHVEKNKKFIEQILKNDFDLKVNLRFKTIDFAQEGIPIQPRTPEEILEDLKNKEPIIRKIIETFDLEDIK
jgi:DNA polymerase-3 subunit gamma/tau